MTRSGLVGMIMVSLVLCCGGEKGSFTSVADDKKEDGCVDNSCDTVTSEDSIGTANTKVSSTPADAGNGGWTRARAVDTASTLLCDALSACFGNDYIQPSDCKAQMTIGSNEGCAVFVENKADECIECLKQQIGCTEIRGLTLFGYSLNQYCPFCDEMCGKGTP